MANETDIAMGVMKIAAQQANHIATFDLCRSDIPKHVALDTQNLAPSITRPGEPMWHQLVRNIKSHEGEDDNYITMGYLEHVPETGYKITPAGLALL